MWEIAVALAIWVSPPESPYVSCIDGHIAPTLADCPQLPKHVTPQTPYGGPPPRGGGGAGGGLLGGLIGGLL